MKTDQFDYDLPKDLIALFPTPERDGSRLLVLDSDSGRMEHHSIRDLPDLLPKGALLVANDTRVVPARLYGRRPTGGSVELLITRVADANAKSCRIEALSRSSRPLKIGDRLDLDGASVRVEAKGKRGEVDLSSDMCEADFMRHVNACGRVPLPPYIKREPEPDDRGRYQTVYARRDGSVAAPTAGLHFTPRLIEEMEERGVEMVFVTLHVGPGTFRPIEAADVEEHRMDSERYILEEATVDAIELAKREGRPVIAVGTTAVRALEGCVAERGRLAPVQGSTELFIAPGFEFKVVDGMLTNFHLPRSTLLCLVSALAGRERILGAYGEAVRLGYRFYSYGDAMLITPEKR